jgi:catechol 2,3-dioxygenase-like lactoylglutathione lyase family enzyme
MARTLANVTFDRVLRRIHHAQILIPAGREADARAFYCGLLGLVEVAKPENLRARGGFWLAVGAAQQLHVGIERDFADRSATREHVAYEVDDLEATRLRLGAAGVAVKIGEEVPGYRRCELRDPFGNRLELMQPL